MQWDTFQLFQTLLERFPDLTATARSMVDSSSAETLKAAMVGFSQFRPMHEWGAEHDRFMDDRLRGDLALDALDWYEECAEVIRLFYCLALGALLGKFAVGEIDEAGFLLGDAHLPGFVLMNNEQICAQSG
jgi:hypothetical protein